MKKICINWINQCALLTLFNFLYIKMYQGACVLAYRNSTFLQKNKLR